MNGHWSVLYLDLLAQGILFSIYHSFLAIECEVDCHQQCLCCDWWQNSVLCITDADEFELI